MIIIHDDRIWSPCMMITHIYIYMMLVLLENNASRVKRSTSTSIRCTTEQGTSFCNAKTDILAHLSRDDFLRGMN